MSERVIILAQIGSPKSLKLKDLWIYLNRFLLEVANLPRWWWWPLLNFLIIPLRILKVIKKYSHIWDGKSFLLPKLTERVVELAQCERHDLKFDVAYLFSSPTIDDLCMKYAGRELVVIPMFPQYALSTTGPIEKKVKGRAHFVSFFHCNEKYLSLSAEQISSHCLEKGVDFVIISFHSIPQREIDRGDIYHQQCLETFTEIKRQLSRLSIEIELAFQSQMKWGRWIGPFLDQVIEEQIGKGRKKIAIFPAGFLFDCLETLYDLNEKRKEVMKKHKDVELSIIPALNDKVVAIIYSLIE